MSGHRFCVPLALPWDVNVIRVNYRCLNAPHIYRDLDGYFTQPPVIRRIHVGLVDVPKGFEAVVQPRVKHIAMLPILTRMAVFDFNAPLPIHIFRFGVDKPKVSHV